MHLPTLIFLLMFLAAPVSAEVRRPFSTRFEANEPGDIFLIGNTSLRADPNDPDAVNSQNGIGSRINNNNFNMVNVDVDADGSTFNSSSADFSIPSGGEVLWAGLYWGADVENATATNPPDINIRNQVLYPHARTQRIFPFGKSQWLPHLRSLIPDGVCTVAQVPSHNQEAS